MNERFIRNACVWVEPEGDDGAALFALREAFGKRAARRMTRLGMMLSTVLRELSITEQSSIIYATTFSETCAIEKFLDSFPYPSPQLFQTSIHPSAVEQYLIQHRQPVREFFPIAGEADLLPRALDCLLACTGENLILCGGEERGTWLRESGISSETNYAWAIELGTDAPGTGRLRWAETEDLCAGGALSEHFFRSLQQRVPVRLDGPGGGYMELSWSE